MLRALSETDLVPGMSVLVIGDGTVALLAAHLVRLWSPSGVTVSGGDPNKRISPSPWARTGSRWNRPRNGRTTS